MNMQILFQVIESLEREELQQLRSRIDAQLLNTPEPQPEQKQPRILGMHPGAIWVSDDFTDPLPDEFWLGGE